jgi:hypothetical protein
VETKVWSLPIIEGETTNIIKYCPWFNKLLKGVFVSNVMVLSSAQLNRQNAPAGKVRLHIPQCQAFVQALYANVAARLFNHPNIFRTVSLTSDQLIDKRNLANREIEIAIDATVRSLLPIPQVIESSMNFSGNNPVITARPPPPPPTPTARVGAETQRSGSRVSSRTIETKRQNFAPKPRLTPPAPPANIPAPAPVQVPAQAPAPATFQAHATDTRRRPSETTKINEFRQSAPKARGDNRGDKKSQISFRAERKQSPPRRIFSKDVQSVREQLDMESAKSSSSSRSSSTSSSNGRHHRRRTSSSSSSYSRRRGSPQSEPSYHDGDNESSQDNEIYI